MRIGIVHTFASPCACHATLLAALAALGHEAVECDSEDVPRRAAELARLDLVFDWTDRFRGEGLLRPVVRRLLEARGARCVGSSADAVFVADDKLLTKARLEAAGVPVARGAPVTSPDDARGLDLPFPRVVKPATEHMSRGLGIVRDEREQAVAVGAALEASRGPCLVETYVEGRELGVTGAGNAPDLRILRAAEWPVAPGDGVLDYRAKREGRDPVAADLPPDVEGTLDRLAARAFAALGLADIARFDVRLAPDGTPFFLEANAIPSLEPGSPTLVSAAAAGLDATALVGALVACARARHGR